MYVYIYIYIYILYVHTHIYINKVTRFKLRTLYSKVLNVTNRANIFVKDMNNKNQLSLHGVLWVLPNLLMTIQYYYL